MPVNIKLFGVCILVVYIPSYVKNIQKMERVKKLLVASMIWEKGCEVYTPEYVLYYVYRIYKQNHPASYLYML